MGAVGAEFKLLAFQIRDLAKLGTQQCCAPSRLREVEGALLLQER